MVLVCNVERMHGVKHSDGKPFLPLSDNGMVIVVVEIRGQAIDENLK